MLEIVFHPKAIKELLALPKEIRIAVLKAIAELQKTGNPLEHRKVIKLKGRTTKDYRLRAGNYRVKFTLRNSTVFITHVQHRHVGY